MKDFIASLVLDQETEVRRAAREETAALFRGRRSQVVVNGVAYDAEFETADGRYFGRVIVRDNPAGRVGTINAGAVFHTGAAVGFFGRAQLLTAGE